MCCKLTSFCFCLALFFGAMSGAFADTLTDTEALNRINTTPVEVKPFLVSSFADIKAQYALKSHMIVLWSLTCGPCLKEMDFIKAWEPLHKDVAVIFISTDGMSELANVEALIRGKDISHWQHWIFADEYEEKLRFHIDPSWRGELPRTYLNRYRDNHMESVTIKGLMNEIALDTWFN